LTVDWVRNALYFFAGVQRVSLCLYTSIVAEKNAIEIRESTEIVYLWRFMVWVNLLDRHLKTSAFLGILDRVVVPEIDDILSLT
jgi:hypothetical protein